MSNAFLITGGYGFLGSHIYDLLDGQKVFRFPRYEYDLESYEQTRGMIQHVKREFSGPIVVINCSAIQGGIGFNKTNPVDLLERNIQININLMRASKALGVSKVIHIASSCAYPDLSEPIQENQLFDGPANESIKFHAEAKRVMQLLCEAYSKQYSFSSVCLCLTNLYGPRANFDEHSSKVVEAAIRKIVDAKVNNKPNVEFYGSGKPLRQLMYVKDAAQAVINHINYDDSSQPRNIGCPDEISIEQLIETIVYLVEYDGEIMWDGRPDGQMRKFLNIDNMYPLEYTPLVTGLKETIEWYCQEKGIKLW